MPNISQMAGTSPVTLKASYGEPIATATAGTVVIQNQFGTTFTPLRASCFVGAIGAGAANMDVQVGGVSILTATITLVANSAVAGTVVNGTEIAANTDITFIFTNASGGNITEVQGCLTGVVTHV